LSTACHADVRVADVQNANGKLCAKLVFNSDPLVPSTGCIFRLECFTCCGGVWHRGTGVPYTLPSTDLHHGQVNETKYPGGIRIEGEFQKTWSKTMYLPFMDEDGRPLRWDYLLLRPFFTQEEVVKDVVTNFDTGEEHTFGSVADDCHLWRTDAQHGSLSNPPNDTCMDSETFTAFDRTH
jgi:hypothetical protein